jgi:hypothetical protein
MTDDAGTWATYNLPIQTLTTITWDAFRALVIAAFVPQGELTKTKLAFDRLQCGKTEAITAFNNRWRTLRMILDADPLRPSDEILADMYVLKVSNNTPVSLAFASFRYANQAPLTLQQTMRIFEDLDNQSQGIFALSGTPDGVPLTQAGDPMDLSRHEARSKTDWTRGDYSKAECWECGKKGHLARDCPEKTKKPTSKPKDTASKPKDTKTSKPKGGTTTRHTKRKTYAKAVNRFEALDTDDSSVSGSDTEVSGKE